MRSFGAEKNIFNIKIKYYYFNSRKDYIIYSKLISNFIFIY